MHAIDENLVHRLYSAWRCSCTAATSRGLMGEIITAEQSVYRPAARLTAVEMQVASYPHGRPKPYFLSQH